MGLQHRVHPFELAEHQPQFASLPMLGMSSITENFIDGQHLPVEVIQQRHGRERNREPRDARGLTGPGGRRAGATAPPQPSGRRGDGAQGEREPPSVTSWLMRPVAEQVLPVVALDLGARSPAEKRQLQRARVGDVGAKVHQALRRPPQRHRRGEGVTVLQEYPAAQERDGDLEEAPPEHREEAPERHEQHVSCLVERQVDEVQERAHQVLRVDAVAQEAEGPQREDGEQDGSRGEAGVALTGAGRSRPDQPSSSSSQRVPGEDTVIFAGRATPRSPGSAAGGRGSRRPPRSRTRPARPRRPFRATS